MSAEATGELAHAFDRCFSSLTNYIRRAKFPRQRNTIGMAAQHDDLLGAKASCGDHAAQADRAIADNRRDLAGTDHGSASRVMASSHHVAECE